MANGTAVKPGTRKITMGALGGAVVAIIAYGFKEIGQQPLPAEIVAAATTVVTALLVYMTNETYG